MTGRTVSVIIPARNAASTIERQLEAVCAQSADAVVELLVVDNGSVDATRDVVEKFASIHSEVRLVPGPAEPNRSATRNVGAASASGSVLAFCDADDVVETGWLSALLDGLERSEVVTGSLVSVDEADEGSSAEFRTVFRGVDCLASGNFAITRSLFKRIGGFSESFKHRVDVELSCRLIADGAAIAYEPAARIRYVRRSTVGGSIHQHFWWAVAGARIQKIYGTRIDFTYSWKNSVKHWLLVGPSLVRAAVGGRDLRPTVLTLARLAGQLVGSIRYGVLAI